MSWVTPQQFAAQVIRNIFDFVVVVVVSDARADCSIVQTNLPAMLPRRSDYRELVLDLLRHAVTWVGRS